MDHPASELGHSEELLREGAKLSAWWRLKAHTTTTIGATANHWNCATNFRMGQCDVQTGHRLEGFCRVGNVHAVFVSRTRPCAFKSKRLQTRDPRRLRSETVCGMIGDPLGRSHRPETRGLSFPFYPNKPAADCSI